MIILSVDEHCQECPDFTPDTRKIFGDDKCILTEVTCSNKELCDRLKTFLQEKTK
jgi:hypothetical protein